MNKTFIYLFILFFYLAIWQNSLFKMIFCVETYAKNMEVCD